MYDERGGGAGVALKAKLCQVPVMSPISNNQQSGGGLHRITSPPLDMAISRLDTDIYM